MPRERAPIIMVSPHLVDGVSRDYSLFDKPAREITTIRDIIFFASPESVIKSAEELGPFATKLALKLMELGVKHVGLRSDKITLIENEIYDLPTLEEIDRTITESLALLYSNYRMPARIYRRAVVMKVEDLKKPVF